MQGGLRPHTEAAPIKQCSHFRSGRSRVCHGIEPDTGTCVPFFITVCAQVDHEAASCLLAVRCRAVIFVFPHYNAAARHSLGAQPDAGREWVVASLSLSDLRPTGAWHISSWHSQGACRYRWPGPQPGTGHAAKDMSVLRSSPISRVLWGCAFPHYYCLSIPPLRGRTRKQTRNGDSHL